MKIPRKGFVTLVLALIIFLSMGTSSLAAAEVSISQGYLKVWPEYTQSHVIVNFSSVFVNQSLEDFHDELSFTLPKDGVVYLVSETQKGLYNVPFEVAEAEDYQVVKWKPSQPIKPGEEYGVMLEYSFSPFTQGGMRDIQLTFVAPAKIQNLAMEIQEPLRAQNFEIKPPAKDTYQDLEGFTFHTMNFENLAAGEKLDFSIKYTKEDNNPSVNTDITAPQDEEKGNSNTMLIVFFIFFVVLLGIMLIISLSKNDHYKHPNKRPSGRSK